VSPSIAADYGGLGTSLKIKSDFIIGENEGPPAAGRSINKYTPSYLLDFKHIKYKRSLGYSIGDTIYVQVQDYYGLYKLSAVRVYSLKDYVAYRRDFTTAEKWRAYLNTEVGKTENEQNKGAVEIEIPWDLPKQVQSIIGEGRSNIRVTGSRSINFSGRSEWDDGVVNTGTYKNSKFPALQMEQKSRFKITGTIGSKITVEVDQDSERYTDLANTIKLRYTGEEDEIIQTIEAGNTNLSLPNSQFIGYSENVQGLFGIKSTARIGNLDLTMIASQDKGSSERSNFVAGAQASDRQIRDYEYLPRTYYWLGVPPRPVDADSMSVVLVRLFNYDQNSTFREKGIACVNLPDSLPNVTTEELTTGDFEYKSFKEFFDFQAYPAGYIVLNQQLAADDVLGVMFNYVIYRSSGQVDTVYVGNDDYRRDPTGQNDTTYVLQLLKHQTSSANFETVWNRMWRNVYDLRSRDISPDGFELRIFKGTGTVGNTENINDEEDQDGVCYVHLLGLDNLNNSNGSSDWDCLGDYSDYILDASRGHLIFPNPKPFADTVLTRTVPGIYTLPYNNGTVRDSTAYYIRVKTAEKSSTYSLGRANIIDGSEVVKLQDGTILKKGVDYNINYDIGQITFISQRALDPGANVSVNFEYAPFFMPEKKSLFGMAAQYQLFKNSNVSVAAMYRKETASEPRPKVGKEPRKGFVWDSNFSFRFEPDLMTSMVDILPLVETDAKSSLDFSGELAQSMPNPNTRNQAFIDDFEGTLNYTDLSTRRGIWTVCSPPLVDNTTKKDLAYKSKIMWYNLFNPQPITNIWPDIDVKSQDNRIDILDLKFIPDQESSAPESTWAGIMRPLYSGMSDQSLSKFVEIWYFPDPNVLSGAPTMYIDLGLISEDLNNNTIEDTEDANRNNVFIPDEEDTGLDGLFDVDEPGYDPITNPDPNGDDWYYDPDVDENNFDRINGTEGNKNDPDRLGRFDTEDINNNGSLDLQNGYFEYAIDLNNPEYFVDETSTGWKLLRIPLRDPASHDTLGISSSADFTRISYARLWFTGTTQEYRLRIATFRIIGNKWQELPIGVPEGDDLRQDEKFDVTTLNTQENSLIYYPPPGIAGELDRETGLREKEQSLVLNYQNMPAGHLGGAYWTLYQTEDYTQYQKMKMYVHGDSSTADSNVTFFFRMSQDGTNFYEYHTVLQPDWVEGNWVDIDFAEMTNLKYALHNSLPDSIPIAQADTTDGHYRIFGNPSLSQVKMFIVGVEIAEDEPGMKTGQVWIDELRVTDIRRKSDFAGRLQATARFADLGEVNLSYQKTGADFAPLSSRTPTGMQTSTRSARFSLNANKFFPPSLGMSMPLNYNWQNTLSLPRLKPGSDIILQDEAKEFEKTENTQDGYGGSLGFNRRTQNPIWNLTVNPLKFNYSYSHSRGTSPANPVNDAIRYQGKGTYDYTVRKKPSVKLLSWTKYLRLPGSISGSEFSYTPSKFGISAEVNGNNTLTRNIRDIVTVTRKKDLSLSGNLGYDPFNSLKATYSLNSIRDLTDPVYFKPSINPAKLKLGREIRYGQKFDTSFQPKIVNMIDNRFSFGSNYTENSDFKTIRDSTRTTDLQTSLKGEFTIKLPLLFGNKGGGRTQRGGNARGKQEDKKPKDGEDDEDVLGSEKQNVSPLKILKAIGHAFKTVKPIRAVVQKDRKLSKRGFIERPSWKYYFGFADNPRARIKSTGGGYSNTDNTIITDTYNFDSGLQPFSGLDISTAYNYRSAVNRRGSVEPTRTKSVTFPDLTVNITGIEKISFFKALARNIGWQFGYTKKVDESSNADTGEMFTRDTEKRYAPLANITLGFTQNLRASVRYESSSKNSKNLRTSGQNDRQVDRSDNSLKFNITYSFTAPQGLKIPLLKSVKFNSQLSITLDITISNSKSETLTNGRRTVDINQKNTTIEPKLSYQFSRAITGGLRARWNDSDDKIQQRKHHIRELGIWTEIKF